MNEQNNGRSSVNLGSILIRIAAVMFVLIMITTHMLGGMFARYVSNGQGADAARVAGFDVKVTGPVENVECNITALEPGKISLSVKNDSEVAVSYSFRIVINEQAGCGVRVTLDDDKNLEFLPKERSELTFSSVGYLGVNAAEVSHTLAFTVMDWTAITKNVDNKESVTLEQSFEIYVDVVQVD